MKKRCEFSEEGRREFRNPDRKGTILGESVDRTCWRLCWDGQKAPGNYHKSFITVLE